MLVLLYSERVLCDAMTKKNQHFFLLEDAGAAIGFASCTPHYARSKVTHLNKLYVRPAVKGHGAGKARLPQCWASPPSKGTRRSSSM
ncbi:MAG: GNAT family N-acetyltransferase [Flavobacteriales bacterium]|nr:GNAT family N-acetyltransferase [Flavobacteriales bacterium]